MHRHTTDAPNINLYSFFFFFSKTKDRETLKTPKQMKPNQRNRIKLRNRRTVPVMKKRSEMKEREGCSEFVKIRDFVDLGFYRVWVCVQMQRRRVRDNEASRIPNRVGSLSLIGFSFFFLMIHVSINGVKSDILMIHCSLLICSSSRFLRQSASQALSHSCSESALRLPQQSTAQCSPAVHFRYK